MASSTQGVSRFTRRILWLAAGIAIVALAYTATWYYLAQQLERRAVVAIEDLNGDGIRAHCEEAQAQGYPFRIGIACRSVFYEDAHDGFSVRAGALQSLANVYQPFRVFSQLDAPAEITLPVFEPFEARWERLHASMRLAERFPERVSLEGEGVVAADSDGRGLGEVEALQIHARKNGVDADIAVSFLNFLLDREIAAVPALDGRARATIDGGVALLESRTLDPRGKSGVIQELIVGIAGEEAEVSFSGPVSVDDNGLINAELTVRLAEPAAVARVLSEILPEARDDISSAAAVFSSLDGTPIQLRVVNGRAFLGFIPLGEIPAL